MSLRLGLRKSLFECKGNGYGNGKRMVMKVEFSNIKNLLTHSFLMKFAFTVQS